MPGAASSQEDRAPTSRAAEGDFSPKTPNSRKRIVEGAVAKYQRDTPKRFKTNHKNVAGMPLEIPKANKRKLSEADEAMATGIKRAKKSHMCGEDRPAVAGRKRGREEDDQGGRMDAGTKKHRTGYFQDGDPPLEYEEWSDSDSDEPENWDPALESESDGDEDEEGRGSH